MGKKMGRAQIQLCPKIVLLQLEELFSTSSFKSFRSTVPIHNKLFLFFSHQIFNC